MSNYHVEPVDRPKALAPEAIKSLRRAQVKGPPDPKSFRGLGADDRNHGRRADRVEQPQQVRFGGGTVLKVQHDPVETRLAAQLGGQWRGEIGEHADEGLAGADAHSKVGHAADDAVFVGSACDRGDRSMGR